MKLILLTLLSLSLLVGCAGPGGFGGEESQYSIKAKKIGDFYEGTAEIWVSPTIRQSSGRLVHSRPEGVWHIWGPDGQKIVDVTYSRGAMNGSVEMWYGSRAPESVRGRKKLSGEVRDGRFNGVVTTYGPGQARLERTFVSGSLTTARSIDSSGAARPYSDAMAMARDQGASDERYLATIHEVLMNSIAHARHEP